MPDISMCDSETCPLRATCYRNKASGTKPTEHYQSYFFWDDYHKEGEECTFYWPTEERK